MKKHLIGLFMLMGIVLSLPVQAQEERQFLIGGDHPVGVSGFGGPIVEISSLENEVIVSGGGGLALLLDQTFFVGLYGLGTVKSLEQSVAEYPEVDMAFGHGGLWLGYIHQSQRLLHAGLSLKMGGGGAVLASRERNEFIFEEENKIDEDGFFVLTPQAEIELNVAPWMKINASVGYRYVSGVQIQYLDEKDFKSVVGNVGFYFGWFKPKDTYEK